MSLWDRLFRQQQREEELDEEVQAHLRMAAQERMEQGESAEQAHASAVREFGNVTLVKEVTRGIWGWGFWETCSQDARYSLRQLKRNLGFTAVAVITLALGIGANTAIFSLLNGVLLRPLSFSQPDRLVSITDSYPQGALVAMRANLLSMEVAGYSDGQELNLTGLGDAVRIRGSAVSANFFSLLGVRPGLGRTFLPDEDQAGTDNVVILSHTFWQQRFGGDPNVIGRWLTLEGGGRQVVGVMPAGFQIGSSEAQLWVPLHLDPRAIGPYWGGGFMPVIGRLRIGVTLEQARAELRAYIPQMRGMFPWKMPDELWASSTLVPLRESLVGSVRTKLILLLGATGLVLLIACANVANLLVARAATRQKEVEESTYSLPALKTIRETRKTPHQRFSTPSLPQTTCG
jgi:predicted permease